MWSSSLPTSTQQTAGLSACGFRWWAGRVVPECDLDERCYGWVP
jgi:hypothetical protein